MTLHLNLSRSHHRSGDQQNELREARRVLRERIRNDWEYPPLPAYRSCGRREPEPATEDDAADTIAGFRFHTPPGRNEDGSGTGHALGLDFDPLEWREREYSDLDVSDTEAEGTPSTPHSSKSKRSEYQFDGPDSVGQQLDAKRQARKRTRLLALQTEMEWNDGLSHWMRRRDIWCSARHAAELRMHETSHAATDHDDGDSASATDSSSSRPSTAASSAEEDPDPTSTPDSTPSVSPDLATGLSTATAAVILAPMMDVLVPIAPPLLPNHPIRRRINHNTYPEIYSKIIIQSRSPSIPINLRTLIGALVQGWKDDGEWPPKTGPIEKSIGRKKGARDGSFKDNMRAVGRVLRITGTSEVG